MYLRLELPWLLFGWAGLVIVFYYLILIPVYILVFFGLDSVAFALTFGDITLWHVYTTLVKLAMPELIITVVITTIILAALPPKYRCPLWCQYDSSKTAVKNSYLAIRLTVWFLVLSFLPFAIVAIFVLNSVESGFDRLTIDHQRERSQLLATALSNATEPQIIPYFQEQYFTPQNSFSIIDLNGQYLFHPDSPKIGTSINTDFNIESVGLILSGETKAFIDDHRKRVVGCARIKGQKKIVVTISDNDFANGIVSGIQRSSQIKLALGFFIISIVGGIAIWLVVGHPIRKLTQSAQRIGKGNLDIELDPGGAVDELQVLSIAFNEMANRLRYLIKGLKEKVIVLEKTEERLRYSENQYRSLNDNIPVGVFRSTPHGEILSINSSLFQMLDLEDENATNTITANRFYENPEDGLGLLAAINSKKQVNGFECRLKRSDGTTFCVSISARCIEDTDGQIKYIDGIIEDITEREKAEQKLKTSEAMLRALSIRLQEIEEANRKEIARELHDRVGQSLTALNINLNILQKQCLPEQKQKIGERLQDSIDLVEKTTVNIRDVMAELRPQVLDDYGLAASLRWYRERFSKRTGIKVDLETAAIEETRLPEMVETVLFRITQEAFNNVIKHARAANVSVVATKGAKSIQLAIADDGKGFDASANLSSQDLEHWGLVNMRERTEALNGHFKIDSEPGKGTRLRVEIPIIEGEKR